MIYNNCFIIDNWFAYDLATTLPSLYFFFNFSTELSLLSTDSLMEIILNNVIKIYKDTSTVKQISNFVAEYLLI